MAELILAGDVGGTNTRLGLFDEKLNPVGEVRKFKTGDGRQLESQIEEVLRAHGSPVKRACLAAAGPIVDGICEPTNIPRRYIAQEIRKTLGLDQFTLINDLVANAAGVELLDASEVVELLPGEHHNGTRAIVSPGTGLGEGVLVWDGRYHRPYPSEGGHSRFAPTTPLEVELLQYLLKPGSTVICEDLISGRGIETIFEFFVARGAPVPAELKANIDATAAGARGALISQAALNGDTGAAKQALDLFVRLIGIEAASMAVKVFAIGGVYLGGGIPPKILPLLKTDTLRQAFLTHRTMSHFLARIPVRVILNDDTALEGAALYGLRFKD